MYFLNGTVLAYIPTLNEIYEFAIIRLSHILFLKKINIPLSNNGKSKKYSLRYSTIWNVHQSPDLFPFVNDKNEYVYKNQKLQVKLAHCDRQNSI